jgi:hypothetical protein
MRNEWLLLRGSNSIDWQNMALSNRSLCGQSEIWPIVPTLGLVGHHLTVRIAAALNVFARQHDAETHTGRIADD